MLVDGFIKNASAHALLAVPGSTASYPGCWGFAW